MEMTEIEKLESALRNADAAFEAGNESAGGDAKGLAAAIAQLKSQQSTVSQGISDLDGYVPDENSPGIAFMKGATMNLSDEATGGIAALYMKMHDLITGKQSPIDWISGKGVIDQFGNEAPGFKKNYETARDQVRADQDAYATKWPKTDLALQLGGGVLTGGYGAAKALATNVAKQSPKIALSTIAAIEGAGFGFGEGEGEEDSIQKAKTQALISAVAAPVLEKVIRSGAKVWSKSKAKGQYADKANTLDDLKAESEVFYDLAEKSGIKVRPGAWAKFRKDSIAKLKSEGIDVLVKRKTPTERGVSGAIARMLEHKEPSYQDLAAMKELLKSAKRSNDGSVSKAAYDLSNMLDDFVDNLSPGKVSAGSIVDLAENIAKAKDYWTRLQTGKTLANAREKATLTKTATKDADFDEAINSSNRSIVNPESSKKSRGMMPKTITDLKAMIIGSRGKNIARFGAGMDPGSGTARGISPAMGGGILAIGGVATLGPLGALAGLFPLLPPVLGRAFKGIANNMTRKEYTAIENAVLNKGMDTVEEMVEKMVKKYSTNLAGISAAASAEQSGNISKKLPSSLTDMISP